MMYGELNQMDGVSFSLTLLNRLITSIKMLREKYLLLDAMGVIFLNEDDIEELFIPYVIKRFPDIDIDKLNELYYEKLSTGIISSSEFFRLLGIPNIEHKYLDMCLKLDPEFKKVIYSLSKKYELSMLSNDVSEWSLFLRNKFGLNQYFENYIISGDVNLRKPDIMIFEKTLEILDTNGDSCIFVDNSLENLEMSNKVGMITIHFKRSESNCHYIPDYTVKTFLELKKLIIDE